MAYLCWLASNRSVNACVDCIPVLLLLLCRVLMLVCTVTAAALAHCCVVLSIYRTVPSDIFQAFAASSLMFEDFGVTQVGVVYEANTYGYGLIANLAPNDGEICNRDTTVSNTYTTATNHDCSCAFRLQMAIAGPCTSLRSMSCQYKPID